MSTLPAEGALGPSVGNVSQSAFKTAIEQLVAGVKEMVGGAGFYGSTKTLSADTFSVEKGYSLYNVDGEGSAADVLANITAGSTTLRDGQMIGVRTTGVVLSIPYGTGGATGRVYSRTGATTYLRDTTEIAWFRYQSSNTAWYQVNVDWHKMLALMLGFSAIATLSPTSNVVTPSSAHILVDSGATVDVNQIARTNFPVDGPFLLVGCANATYARTLKHNTGGSIAGKLYHTDSADIVMDATTKWVLYYATTVSGYLAWVEIARFGFSSASGGGFTVKTKSTNFDITETSNTRFLIDTSDGDIVATIKVASTGSGAVEWQFWRVAGTGKISFVFASPAASDTIFTPLDSAATGAVMEAGVTNMLSMIDGAANKRFI